MSLVVESFGVSWHHLFGIGLLEPGWHRHSCPWITYSWPSWVAVSRETSALRTRSPFRCGGGVLGKLVL